MERSEGRSATETRDIKITTGFVKHAEGSCLIEVGQTSVICAASWEERVPRHVRGSGKGWITAEYGMLPRSTHTRTQREARQGKQGGRTIEIQRLLGRSLRSVVDMKMLGERTLILDCDVLTADGGTRTASISGAFVAMCQAFKSLQEKRFIAKYPIRDMLAAISVGMAKGEVLLDLDYKEDSKADVDMNVVMTGSGGFVEVQGTGETGAFKRSEMDQMLDAAWSGIQGLMTKQREALGFDPVLQE